MKERLTACQLRKIELWAHFFVVIVLSAFIFILRPIPQTGGKSNKSPLLTTDTFLVYKYEGGCDTQDVGIEMSLVGWRK